MTNGRTWIDTTYEPVDTPMVNVHRDDSFSIHVPGYQRGGGFTIHLSKKQVIALIEALRKEGKL